MIRTNLSTRPFYNERPVHLWFAAAALLAVAATVFNGSAVMSLSRADTRLATKAASDQAQAQQLRAAAARLRVGVDRGTFELAATQARLANELIDRRTFSWTELFNRFEATLPDDVRITSVRPKVDNSNTIWLDVSVVAKSVDDVNLFMEKLEATGAFANLLSRNERFTDQGLLEAGLEARYVPSVSREPAPGPTHGPTRGSTRP